MMTIRCAAVLGIGFALASGGAFSQARGDPARGTAKAVLCTSCHGSLQRSPLPGMPNLAGQQAEFLVMQMFLMREGLRDVPQMAGMLKGYADRDLEDVAAYFSGQPPPPASGKRDPQLYARGEGLAPACGSCHLKDFRGQRHIPRITNQHEDYLAATLRAYRDDKRAGADTSMNAAMYQVSDNDIRALAHYLAHQ
ncbi:MAG: c-type cytochrome [Burkholderiales bacterium]|nr:c-type cytochrome [Burkholderiales bacterium]